MNDRCNGLTASDVCMGRVGVPSDAVIIVGGGLSGLAAAVQLGRLAARVVLFDDAVEIGGRARTQCRKGFHLNFGPHRLYERGAAVAGLRQLGVPIDSAPRGPNGGFAIWRGTKHTLPVGYCSLLTTDLFGLAAKLEAARFLSAIPAVRVSLLHDVALAEWLGTQVHDPRVFEFVLALVRFTTYVNDPERLSAAAAVEQLALSLAGPVLYIHKGWGTLVAALRAAAVAAGARIVSGRRVIAVNAERRRAVSVTLAGGEVVDCRAVVGAIGPNRARALFGCGVMPTGSAPPVCVAALDLALKRLPVKRAVFALGVDVPVSFSADSAFVSVAPRVGAVVHVAKYLRPGACDAAADEAQLERTVDLLQPGWRDLVLYRRFLPSVVVSHALATADGGGIAGRPDGRVQDLDNVFLAGDWIGPTGQLADASVSSGIRAAHAVHCRFTAA
jgi:phytoene dehydrogenase-like protein